MSEYNTWIRRILAKDDSAFTELYERTHPLVYSVIYAIVRDRQATEDLMQDTYLKMVQALHTYNGSVHFQTWLLTIAKNQAIDYYRREKRMIHVDVDTAEALMPHRESRSESTMESERFLAVLSSEERQIVLLKIVNRMTHREIAEVMQKPVGTIMWMYNTALKKMQKAEQEDRHA